jgi:DNA mismatch repair protein MutS
VRNYTISVKEWKDQIVFLRRLIKGVCNRSYGIQVGRLAGLPEEVVKRAREVLTNLEGGEYDEIGSPRLSRSGAEKGRPASGQLQLFAASARSPSNGSEALQELADLDLDTVSPLEALQILHKLKGGQ